jgi:hypothetical protein
MPTSEGPPKRIQDPRIVKLDSVETMFAILKEKGTPFAQFHKGDRIYVWNKMVRDYSYLLEEEPGRGMDPSFQPASTPGEILALGAFGGKYLNDCLLEFPAEWFWHAGLLGKLCPSCESGGDPVGINYFAIDSRLPLSAWKEKGWVPSTGRGSRSSGKKSILADPEQNPDERGWFQWYCRYWMGRRLPALDAVQIQRWKNFRRHSGAVKKGCKRGDLTCRPRQRQALLHWAWPFDT